MFKINLVPEVQEKKLKVRKVNTYSTIAAVSIAGLTVAAIFVLGTISAVKKLSLNSTEDKIKTVNEELKEYKELEETVLSLEKGLAGVKQIMNGGNNWALLYANLEKATPADVAFESMSIKDGVITAQMQAESVEGLGRFVDSLKSYQVVVLSGTATEGETVTVVVDEIATEVTRAKTGGAWKLPLTFDPTAAHSIIIKTSDGEKKVQYDPTEKKIVSEDAGLVATIKNLFPSVEAAQYQKESGLVTFEAKVTFEGSALW